MDLKMSEATSTTEKEGMEGGNVNVPENIPESIAEEQQQQKQPDTKGEAPVALAEDTEDDSSQEDGIAEDNNEDGYASTSELDHDDDNDEDSSMPLLKYTRLFGSLPRQPRQEGVSPPLSIACTCSVMAKVLLTPDTCTTATSEVSTSGGGGGSGLPGGIGGSMHGGSVHGGNNTNARGPSANTDNNVPMDLWQKQPIHITATGYQDGQVWLTDATSAVAIAGPEQLRVREGGIGIGMGGGRLAGPSPDRAIVAVSFDASGTVLSAMDASGTCAIWEFKYTVQMRSSASATSTATATTASAPGAAAAGSNVFTNFMSALTGGGSASGSVNSHSPEEEEPEESQAQHVLVPTLCLASVQTSRIPFPKSFGTPTCMAIDPCYKKRREKSIMVGFRDGRLVLTKRGFVFQRRSDAVVYQAVVATDDKNFAGIEAIAWRGSLVAWGDASGVRLLDADTLTRIAHVDRPTGARPSLYPTVSGLRPHLCFETSNKLLVAWGDCLMRLAVRESTVSNGSGAAGTTSSSELSAAAGGSNTLAVVRRRTVECTMAWELDCVACGVAPLDANHIVVLGVVPPVSGEDGVDATVDDGHPLNDVELQVVSRSDGSVIYSDLLPLLRPPAPTQPKKKQTKHVPESLSNYALLSSFAVPRMENAVEALEENVDEDADFDPLQVSIFSAPESKKTFRDSHVRWSLDDAAYEEDVEPGGFQKIVEETRSELTSDTDSVDSDDYDFFFRNPSTFTESNTSKASIPPVMMISTGVDVVLATIRDVDDAVSYALSSKKAGLALRRALRHLRRLRRYDISDLVNEYFRALLRIPETEAATDEQAEGGEQEERPHLSLRRMKLAAAALPVLLGGRIDLWRLWVSELEKIPGALFVVRSFLPVRDPVLPPELYARVLGKMLQQVEELQRSSESDTVHRLSVEAEGHFLNTLIAWGSTDAIKEHIKLFEYQSERDESFSSTLHAAEDSLRHRNEQTAAGYLRFPSRSSTSEQPNTPARRNDEAHDEPQNSLYDVKALFPIIAGRVNAIQTWSSPPGCDPTLVVAPGHMNSRVALDALAKLNMMMGQFDDALRCFLTIGALHSSRSLDAVEDAAIALVNSDEDSSDCSTVPYAFVLAFIEHHHLHEYILSPTFLSEDETSSPLFALVQLVGLDLMGDFLIRHCVAAQQSSTGKGSTAPRQPSPKSSTSDKTDGERRGTLPLDLVVSQLEVSPKLLHWYLHLVFVRKPDIYVKFPNTANPPAAITILHRKHLELYIKYAGVKRDSARALEDVEPYRVRETTTPLLSFLKIVLQLGGIRPTEVGKTLEVERKGGAGVSRTFALELAYIMEHYGDDAEAGARVILQLYLKGAMSLMLAVAYAQRAKDYSSVLWEVLINHCLSGTTKPLSGGAGADGSLFGSLLEAAALSGADLAHLVAQIPPGMGIEGLRPRLVSAVADYRLKLLMHKSSAEIASAEKITLHRERTYRSRRGMRCDLSSHSKMQMLRTLVKEGATGDFAAGLAQEETPEARLASRRTKERMDRHSLAYSLPMR